ncbi:MAG: superoxide dismutase family protein [Clostridia bacterium]|nr:superoxide dismutase family protein [Clostridia bacterium]
MYRNNNYINFAGILRYVPNAVAMVQGGELYPDINGTVRFYGTAYGTVVFAEIMGLPFGGEGEKSPIFGFHIHSGSSCGGDGGEPFPNTGSHYDTEGRPHPYHSGDLPPLFGADGIAFSAFLTDRFTVDEIIGRTVIIHDSPDDFTTQPSGNAGMKIACGEIASVRR